jgi:hypothetical protein
MDQGRREEQTGSVAQQRDDLYGAAAVDNFLSRP